MPGSPMRPSTASSRPSTASSSRSMDSSGGPSSPRFRQAAAGENGLLNLPSSSATTSDTGLSSGGFGGAAGSSMVSGLTRIASTLKQEAAHDPFLRMMSAASEGAADRLLVAAEKGDLPTVEAALAAGVDPNKVAGRNGFTPLHHAVRRGHVGVAQALLKRGRAGVDAATSDALETPLHLAAFHGHLLLANLLLECGADPNARDGDGETPLFVVARRGKCPALAALLLSRRADPAVRNRYNDLAADDVGKDDAAMRRVFAEDAERREAAAEKRGSGGGGSSVASSSSKKEPAGAGGGGGGAAGAMALSTAAPRRKGSSNSIPTITGPMGVLKLSLVVRCLRFLTVRDWGAANAVCKGWRKAARHPKLVKKFAPSSSSNDADTAASLAAALEKTSLIQSSNVDEAVAAGDSRPSSN